MSRASSPLRDRMIFLVGARRSGTNWLQRTLCARPDVAAVPSETFFFSHGISPLVERIHHGAPTSPTTGLVYAERERMLDALRDLCDSIFSGVLESLAPEAERLVERTPDHVRHLGLIGDVYPDARFIHIIRDGRDVVRSLLSQEWGPKSIEEAAEEWRSAIIAARDAAPRLAHYRELRYEDILASPRPVLSDLFTWLGLDASPDRLEAASLEAGVGFNVDHAAPAIAAEKWRETFSAADVKRFDRIAGDMLAKLGYAAAAPVPYARRDAHGAQTEPPSVARRLRRLVADGRARRSGAARREIRALATDGQWVLDRALASLGSRRFEELSQLLSPDAYVRFVGAGTTWEGRGREGRERLIGSLESDPALGGRTVRGDVHPSVPTVTAVTTYRLPDGSSAERVVVATVEGGAITRLTYYQLPLGGDRPVTASSRREAGGP